MGLAVVSGEGTASRIRGLGRVSRGLRGSGRELYAPTAPPHERATLSSMADPARRATTTTCGPFPTTSSERSSVAGSWQVRGRQRRMRAPPRPLAPSCTAPSTAARAVRAAGSCSSSRSCTCTAMCSSPTSLAGAARACPRSPRPRGLRAAPGLGVRGAVPLDGAPRPGGEARVYAREGVTHAWRVDPLAQTLETLRLEGTRWRLLGTYAGDKGVRAEPFEAVEVELGALWAR